MSQTLIWNHTKQHTVAHAIFSDVHFRRKSVSSVLTKPAIWHQLFRRKGHASWHTVMVPLVKKGGAGAAAVNALHKAMFQAWKSLLNQYASKMLPRLVVRRYVLQGVYNPVNSGLLIHLTGQASSRASVRLLGDMGMVRDSCVTWGKPLSLFSFCISMREKGAGASHQDWTQCPAQQGCGLSWELQTWPWWK